MFDDILLISIRYTANFDTFIKKIILYMHLFESIIPIFLLYFIVSSIFFAFKFFTSKDKLREFCKKKMLRGIFSILGIIFVWGIVGLTGNVMGVGQGGSAPIPGAPQLIGVNSGDNGAMSSGSFLNYRYGNQYSNRENITDTRSFIKKTFSANIRTREVETVANKIESLITDKNGRIDSSDISDEYASISFVIPKSELSDFKDELKTYTREKLYTQRTSSQNLLGEKKDLEREQGVSNTIKTNLEAQKKQVEADFIKSSSDLKVRISSKNTQLKNTNSEIAKKDTLLAEEVDAVTIANITSEKGILLTRKVSLTNEIQTLTNELSNVTSNYNVQISTLVANITNQVNVSTNLGTQTESFLDKVETVEGSVVVQNITYLQLFDTYSPISLIGICLILFVFFMIYNIYITFKSYKTLASEVTN